MLEHCDWCHTEIDTLDPNQEIVYEYGSYVFCSYECRDLYAEDCMVDLSADDEVEWSD